MNKKAKIIFLNILIVIITGIYFYFTKDTWSENLIKISWINNIIFLLSILEIYLIKGEIIDTNVIFQLFFFLFSTGQVVLYSLGVNKDELMIFKASSIFEIANATVFFIMAYQVFNLGMLSCTKKINKKIYEKIEDKNLNKEITIISIVMILMSIFQYMIDIIKRLKISIMYGYEYLYNNYVESNIGVLKYSAYFFIPGMFLLLYANRENKIKRRCLIFLLLIISLCNILIGSRGASITIIITLFYFISKYIYKFKKTDLVKLGIVGLIVITIIPVFREFRSVSDKNFNTFIETTTKLKDKNLLYETVGELGVTMHAYILTERKVPIIQNYKYGESYIASFFMLIPSKFLGGESFAEKAALDTWLQNISKLSYGPGFSIVAELYYNFGFFGGIFFALFLGIFYSYIFNIKIKNENHGKLFSLFKLIFLYEVMLSGRYPFHSTLRNLIFIVVIPYIFIILIYNYKRKKEV